MIDRNTYSLNPSCTILYVGLCTKQLYAMYDFYYMHFHSLETHVDQREFGHRNPGQLYNYVSLLV